MTTLVRRRQPSLNTLNVLLEVEPFPGPDPESEHSCDVFVLVFAEGLVWFPNPLAFSKSDEDPVY